MLARIVLVKCAMSAPSIALACASSTCARMSFHVSRSSSRSAWPSGAQHGRLARGRVARAAEREAQVLLRPPEGEGRA